MSSEIHITTDEMLSAYIDGELDPATRQALEKIVARDPVLRAMVEHLQRSDEIIRTAFDPVAGEPVPSRLLAPLRAARQRSRIPHSRPGRPESRRSEQWRLAVAASVALAAGIAAGALLAPGVGGPDSEFRPFASAISRGSPLHVALESVPSDTVHRTRAGTIAPVRTVRMADGRFCREFEGALNATAVRGVACRDGSGDWQLRAALASRSDAQDQEYRPASGAGPDEASALLDSLLDGRTVDLQEEQELIAEGWTGGG